MEHAVAGDIVRFHRGEYSHVAVYVSRGRVIHLWSPTSDRSFSVRIDSIRHIQNCQRSEDVLLQALDEEEDDEEYREAAAPEIYTDEMDAKMLRLHNAEPFDGDEVVRRARTRLGETHYDYLSYNCEHFVTWARYGVGTSPQATSHTNQVIAGALLGAAVGGMAGLVVGGMISLFTKVNALSASSSGVSVGLASAEAAEEGDSDEDEVPLSPLGGSEPLHSRRQERERLIEDISAMHLDEDDGRADEFEAWASARHRSRSRGSVRPYSDECHEALASRLADDKLLCGICFYDLQLTKVVAFPCNHFTCAKCFDALVTNSHGSKCCPYCRMNISHTHPIHRSTKVAARSRLTEVHHQASFEHGHADF